MGTACKQCFISNLKWCTPHLLLHQKIDIKPKKSHQEGWLDWPRLPVACLGWQAQCWLWPCWWPPVLWSALTPADERYPVEGSVVPRMLAWRCTFAETTQQSWLITASKALLSRVTVGNHNRQTYSSSPIYFRTSAFIFLHQWWCGAQCPQLPGWYFLHHESSKTYTRNWSTNKNGWFIVFYVNHTILCPNKTSENQCNESHHWINTQRSREHKNITNLPLAE